MLAAETDIGSICDLVEQTKPGIVVIDSIQTMHCAEISSLGRKRVAGQGVHGAAAYRGKNAGNSHIYWGHVNKDGAIAGPKVMEHIVDTVLYFEGDKMLPYRVLVLLKTAMGAPMRSAYST